MREAIKACECGPDVSPCRIMEIKDAVVKARIEPSLKRETEAILDGLGISTTEAIRMFLTQVRLQKGLPFEVRIPNAATQAAINELESGKGKRFDSVAALFEEPGLVADLQS